MTVTDSPDTFIVEDHEAKDASQHLAGRRRVKTPLLLIVFLVALFTVAAQAGPINYNITFILTSGTVAPTFGQFTYDSNIQVFSAFTVDWNGGVFDLTASANSPNPNTAPPNICPSAAATAAFAFSFFSGGACGANPQSWLGTPASSPPNPTGQFRFGPGNPGTVGMITAIFAPDAGGGTNFGTFSISPASSAPEPSVISFIGLGATAMMVLAAFKHRLKAKRGVGVLSQTRSLL
jgi:hypothetical protein